MALVAVGLIRKTGGNMFDLETIKAMNAPGFKAHQTWVLISHPAVAEERAEVKPQAEPAEAANVYSRHPHRSA